MNRSAAALPFASVRCAIYTRRSVELSSPQDFNSLQAQRSICSSYIASQRPKGWIELPKHYDDMGRTGANLRRPALQQLITDMEHGLINTVVVYKLDRITRTLLDFIRLAELFERFDVHFVSVTQNFDTADSTGRLILNVLLTFAQFEREITSDRLRDKFNLMRERGMFTGGPPPYGYDLVEKKLRVNPAQAVVVGWMFKRFLTGRSPAQITRELNDDRFRTGYKASKARRGIEVKPICDSQVRKILRNPVYVGEVSSGGALFAGRHPAIVSREVWDAVQSVISVRARPISARPKPVDILRGLIFDSSGRTVGVVRQTGLKRNGIRYYQSNQTKWGQRNQVKRLRTNADDLEGLVIAKVCSVLSDRRCTRAMLLREGIHDESLDRLTRFGKRAAGLLKECTPHQAQHALRALLERVELTEDNIRIIMRPADFAMFLEWDGTGLFNGRPTMRTHPHRTERFDVGRSTDPVRRDLAEFMFLRPSKTKERPRKSLTRLIAQARHAQASLYERSECTLGELAARLKCTQSRLSRLIRLNYLAPDIIASILDGTQPNTLTATKLMRTDLPMEWNLQRQILDFPARLGSR